MIFSFILIVYWFHIHFDIVIGVTLIKGRRLFEVCSLPQEIQDSCNYSRTACDKFCDDAVSRIFKIEFSRKYMQLFRISVFL